MNDSQDEKKFQMDITPDVARGVYSNVAVISHAPTEIVLDFAQVMPGAVNPQVRSRVIMSPIHAKRLLAALQDNISKYEDQFGDIEELAPSSGKTIPFDISQLGKA